MSCLATATLWRAADHSLHHPGGGRAIHRGDPNVRTSRRTFLATSGLTLGALTAPDWIEAADANVDLERVADAALAEARKDRAGYADVRINRYRTESISTRERQVQSVSRDQSSGLGVR